MPQKLSTKIYLALCFSILLIIIGISAGHKKNSKVNNGTIQAIIEERVKKSLQEDTDGDGLKNWEESLYNTDPNDADTDKDGTTDGEEIKLKRNPSVAGPNDKQTLSLIDGIATSTKPITATDRFSRELFTKYIEAKQAGKEITPDLQAQIAEDLLSKDYTEDLPTITEADIKISTKEDDELLQSYGNKLATVLSKKRNLNLEQELVILERIMAQGMTEEDKTMLKEILTHYTTIKKGILGLQVPAPFKDSHINIAQGINILGQAIEGILDLSTDPVGSMVKIGRYQDAIDLLNAGQIATRSRFLELNLLFSPTEAGYMFTK